MLATTYLLDVLIMRIHITGNAGSGKTSLASQLGDILDLSVYGLDKIVWGENWSVTPPEERDPLVHELVMKPEWIIEGVSSVVRKEADFVIFLDFPRYVCIKRCVLRTLQFLFSTRPELPDNCLEYKIIPQLTKIIWQFPLIARDRILSDLNRGESIIITNKVELHQFIEEAKHNKKLQIGSENFRIL